MTDTPFDVLAELAALKKFFTSARDELSRGNVISMLGVDKRISTVCGAVQKADLQEQERYLPELTILIDMLNQYEQGLRAFHETQLAAAAKITAQDERA